MEKLLFIKYYYTANEIEQMFEEMQVKVEDDIEKELGAVEVFLHFIDVSQTAYLCDIIDVEHNFDLTKKQKELIFQICYDNIYFVENMDENDPEELAEIYEKKYNLMYAKFRKINEDDIINKPQL